MQSSESVFVIGGPGNISAWTLRKLLSWDCPLTLYTRHHRPDAGEFAGITWIEGDRDDTTKLSEAVEACNPRVIVDTICYSPSQAEAIVDMCSRSDRRVLFVSTVDIYGYPLPNLPQSEAGRRVPTITEYAHKKLHCEEIFMDAQSRGRCKVTIARPAYSFGTGFLLHFTNFSAIPLIKRMKENRPIIMPGAGELPFHASVAANVGNMLASLAVSESCAGKAFNCAHSSVLTQKQYLELIGAVLGAEPVLVSIPVETILELGDESLRNCPLSIHIKEPMAFGIEAFLHEVPDFEWEFSLRDGVRHFLDARDLEQELAAVPETIVDDIVIDKYAG